MAESTRKSLEELKLPSESQVNAEFLQRVKNHYDRYFYGDYASVTAALMVKLTGKVLKKELWLDRN